jgi:hypothetical protein
VGECGFCTVLACPPHPTQFLSLYSLSPKATTTLAFFFLFSFLPFASVLPMHLYMSAASAAPSSQYLQMGEESYFEFLVII